MEARKDGRTEERKGGMRRKEGVVEGGREGGRKGEKKEGVMKEERVDRQMDGRSE